MINRIFRETEAWPRHKHTREYTHCISQQLSVSLHLERVSHEMDETDISISTDWHKKANSDVQTGQQVVDIQQLLTKLLLNGSVVHQRILPKRNRLAHQKADGCLIVEPSHLPRVCFFIRSTTRDINKQTYTYWQKHSLVWRPPAVTITNMKY